MDKENIQLSEVYRDGVKEKLNELLQDTIYIDYGRLIATSNFSFDIALVNDKVKIAKLIASFRKSDKKCLDW